MLTLVFLRNLRTPALWASNSEPLLVDGVLFQLGALPVLKRQLRVEATLKSVATTCLSVSKFVIFRDKVPDWAEFSAHPLRYVFEHVPVLVACSRDVCGGDCGAWHSTPSEALKDPVLELWGKQWMSMTFRLTQPSEAELLLFTFVPPVTCNLPCKLFQAQEDFLSSQSLWMDEGSRVTFKSFGCRSSHMHRQWS